MNLYSQLHRIKFVYTDFLFLFSDIRSLIEGQKIDLQTERKQLEEVLHNREKELEELKYVFINADLFTFLKI